MNYPGLWFVELLKQATGPADRWVMVLSGLVLIAVVARPEMVGKQVNIHRDNQLLMTLTLNSDSITQVAGRLGEVKVEVKAGRARLLEYRSQRLIGTRTGWIKNSGEIAVCVPCGILIQNNGKKSPEKTGSADKLYDGIAR
ncbi:MAG: NusG domain II-containing protein [Magnetococcales bacterium]|nr:NusG domain II-containing protein [Magnetococcales bacterium]